MEKKEIDPKVLEAAKKWAKEYGREILRYAGHDGDRTYFNARDRDMSGYTGSGTAFYVEKDGTVVHDLSLSSFLISDFADLFNQTYNL